MTEMQNNAIAAIEAQQPRERSLAICAAKANDLGMSYGQYIAAKQAAEELGMDPWLCRKLGAEVTVPQAQELLRYEENRRHAEHDGFSPGSERNIRQCRERKKKR